MGHLLHGSLGPPEVHVPNGISSNSAMFAEVSYVELYEQV